MLDDTQAERRWEIGWLMDCMPPSVAIKYTPLLRWHMEIYDPKGGEWYYNGSHDDVWDMLRDYHAYPAPKKLEGAQK